MKRTPTTVSVSDHAVLRYLEREHGLDVASVRGHLSSAAQSGAELQAIAVKIERVKLLLVRNGVGRATVVTVVPRASLSSTVGTGLKLTGTDK